MGAENTLQAGVMFASGAAVGTEHFAIPMLPPAYPATVNNIDHRRSKKGVCLSALAPRRQRRIGLAVVQCPHDTARVIFCWRVIYFFATKFAYV